jgi:hypothetical protein
MVVCVGNLSEARGEQRGRTIECDLVAVDEPGLKQV